MDLALTDGEREHLAALGVSAAADGTLRSSSGAVVSPGTAVALLSKTAISGPAARTGPAGPPGRGVPSGPAGLDGGSGDEVDPDLTGTGDDAAGMAKEGLLAASFRRHYLSAGHQSDSSANTGHYGVTPAQDVAGEPGGRPHVAMPRDFTRGPLRADQEAPSPDSDPGGNNPHPGGAPASAVYGTAAARYADNRAQERAEHLTPTEAITSQPLPERVMLPSSMNANAVPMAAQVHATKPAPGER